jgi:hypothetical protein
MERQGRFCVPDRYRHNVKAGRGDADMPKTLQGYGIKGFPNGFAKILTSWFKVIHDYARRSDGDAIYWYNERANVGAFASALSRNNCPVLEEFVCQKVWKTDKWPGRADISFYQQGVWYLAEAKNKWKVLSDRTTSIDTKKYLDESCNDARAAWQGIQDCVPFGMTFVVPWIRPENQGNIQIYMDALIDGIKKDTYCDFWAYCAPGKFRNLRAPDRKRNYHPMVLVLGKKV